MTKQTVFEEKQQWAERLLASKHTPATKVFALAVFNRAYGDKLDSFPGTKQIAEDTNLGTSKFSTYRKALVESGAMSATLAKGDSGDYENYTYTINLEWDGSIPEGQRSHPEGSTSHPEGSTGGTQRVGGVVPRGSTNTSMETKQGKTAMNPSRKKSKEPEAQRDESSASSLLRINDGFLGYNHDSLPFESDFPFFDEVDPSILVENPPPSFEEKRNAGPVEKEVSEVSEKKTRLPAFAKNKEVLAEARAKKEARAAHEAQQAEFQEKVAKSQNETAKWTEGFTREEREKWRRYTSMFGTGPKLSAEKARERVIAEREWDKW